MNLLQTSTTLLLLLLLFAPLQLGLAVESVPFPQRTLELFLLHPSAVFVRAYGAYTIESSVSLGCMVARTSDTVFGGKAAHSDRRSLVAVCRAPSPTAPRG